MISRIALILLLCSASLPSMAREVRQAGANGDGGCPSALSSSQDRGESVRPSGGQRRADVDPMSRDRPPSDAQGGTENGVRGPRMHSFLPGMFR